MKKNKDFDEIEFEDFQDYEFEDVEEDEFAHKNSIRKISKIVNFVTLASLTFAGSVITKQVILSNHEYLKPITQIESDAKFLDADLLIVNQFTEDNKIIRLKPNSNEPIYVYVDDKLDDKFTNLIPKSLDYIEDCFSMINDDYTFKIVGKSEYEFKKAIGKTTIKYAYTDELGTYAYAINHTKLNKSNLDKIFNNDDTNLYIVNCNIELNKEELEKKDNEKILYTLNHELMHSFGFADLYTGNKDTSSIMNAYYEQPLLSPNDMKALYSAYGDKHLDENGNVDKEKLNEVLNNLTLYEQEFYNHASSHIINNLNLDNIVNYNNQKISSIHFLRETHKYDEQQIYTYAFDLNDNEVELNIYKNNELVETSNGKVIYGKNYVALTNLKVTNDNNTYNLDNYLLFKNDIGIYKIISLDKLSATYAIVNTKNIEKENTR